MSSFEQRWRERFREFAQLRDDDAGIAGWSESGLAARMRRFQELWGERRVAGCWLDAGCGAATYSRFLAACGVSVIAADYSLPSLVKARTRGTEGVALVVADVTRLPLPAASVDGALCFGVTQALADSRSVVAELARVLRPGGELWIDGLNRVCLPNIAVSVRRALARKPRHLRYETQGRLRRALRDAGLVEVRVHWMPILPVRLSRLQPLIERGWVQRVLAAIPPLAALLSHAYIVTGRRPGASAGSR